MRIVMLCIVLCVLLCLSCRSKHDEESVQKKKENRQFKEEYTHEKVDNSSYAVVQLPQEMGESSFAVVRGIDTSEVTLSLGNYLTLNFQDDTYKPHYVQLPLTAIEQVGMILEYIERNATLDTLSGISLRGLNDYGGYSIEITEAYKKEFSVSSPSTKYYSRVCDIVMRSSLVADINNALRSLGYEVSRVYLEKIFLCSVRWEEYNDFLPDTVDREALPDKLLCAMTMLKLKKVVESSD